MEDLKQFCLESGSPLSETLELSEEELKVCMELCGYKNLRQAKIIYQWRKLKKEADKKTATRRWLANKRMNAATSANGPTPRLTSGHVEKRQPQPQQRLLQPVVMSSQELSNLSSHSTTGSPLATLSSHQRRPSAAVLTSQSFLHRNTSPASTTLTTQSYHQRKPLVTSPPTRACTALTTFSSHQRKRTISVVNNALMSQSCHGPRPTASLQSPPPPPPPPTPVSLTLSTHKRSTFGQALTTHDSFVRDCKQKYGIKNVGSVTTLYRKDGTCVTTLETSQNSRPELSIAGKGALRKVSTSPSLHKAANYGSQTMPPKLGCTSLHSSSSLTPRFKGIPKKNKPLLERNDPSLDSLMGRGIASNMENAKWDIIPNDTTCADSLSTNKNKLTKKRGPKKSLNTGSPLSNHFRNATTQPIQIMRNEVWDLSSEVDKAKTEKTSKVSKKSTASSLVSKKPKKIKSNSMTDIPSIRSQIDAGSSLSAVKKKKKKKINISSVSDMDDVVATVEVEVDLGDPMQKIAPKKKKPPKKKVHNGDESSTATGGGESLPTASTKKKKIKADTKKKKASKALPVVGSKNTDSVQSEIPIKKPMKMNTKSLNDIEEEVEKELQAKKQKAKTLKPPPSEMMSAFGKLKLSRAA